MTLCGMATVHCKIPGEAFGEVQSTERDPSILEIPVPWDDSQEQQQGWSRASWSPEDKLYVLQRVDLENYSSPCSESRRYQVAR